MIPEGIFLKFCSWGFPSENVFLTHPSLWSEGGVGVRCWFVGCWTWWKLWGPEALISSLQAWSSKLWCSFFAFWSLSSSLSYRSCTDRIWSSLRSCGACGEHLLLIKPLCPQTVCMTKVKCAAKIFSVLIYVKSLTLKTSLNNCSFFVLIFVPEKCFLINSNNMLHVWCDSLGRISVGWLQNGLCSFVFSFVVDWFFSFQALLADDSLGCVDSTYHRQVLLH